MEREKVRSKHMMLDWTWLGCVELTMDVCLLTVYECVDIQVCVPVCVRVCVSSPALSAKKLWESQLPQSSGIGVWKDSG